MIIEASSSVCAIGRVDSFFMGSDLETAHLPLKLPKQTEFTRATLLHVSERPSHRRRRHSCELDMHISFTRKAASFSFIHFGKSSSSNGLSQRQRLELLPFLDLLVVLDGTR